MADLRRKLKLVLDKALKRRVERETQDALKKGTDPKKPTRNLKKIEGGLGRLKKAALALGGALAAAFGVRAIIRFGKAAVRTATEATGVWSRLSGQLRATGTDFKAVEGEIRRTARALQDATTVGDEDFAAVLTELVGITGDYRASLAEVETVADLAAAKQIDLKTAAQLVGRAMVGQTSTLTRYGIVVGEGADAMEVLRSRFRGMAQNEAASLQGRVSQLSNEWSDLKQAIGDAMIEAGGGTSVLDTLIGTVKGLTRWVEDNRAAIAGWGGVTFEVTKATALSFGGLARVAFNTGQMIGRAFDIAGSLMVAAMLKATETIRVDWRDLASFAQRLFDWADIIPDVDFSESEANSESFFNRAQEQATAFRQDLEDVGAAVGTIARAWEGVARAASRAERAQQGAASAPPASGGSGGSGAGGAGITVPEADLPFQPGPLREFVGINETLAGDFESAWSNALQLIGGEMSDLADRGAQLGVALALGGAEGVERLAGAKMKENMAFAIEEVARGLAATARGNAPAAGLHFAAAKDHGIAAAAWAAVRGAAGAGGGGGRRGGGGTAVPRGAAAADSRVGGEPRGPEVHIYIDPMRANDPAYQRVVWDTMGQAKERFGSVQVHSRSRP